MPPSELKPSLLNTIVLVTGSTGGIGTAICRRLAAQGCSIGLHYNTDKDAALALQDELTKSYGEAFGTEFACYPADMGDYDEDIRCSHRNL